MHAVFLAGPLVAVADAAGNAFKVLDPKSGDVTPVAAFQGYPSWSIPDAADTAWIGIRNPVLETAAASWVLGRDSVRYIVPLPQEYTKYPNLTRFTGLPVVKWADTILVGFGPLNGLILASTVDGAVRDTVFVPRARRRLNSETTVRAADGEWAPLMNGISALNGMARVGRGQIALVYFDNNVPAQGAGMRKPDVFLTILAPALDSACVDVPVPFDGDVQPLLAFRADTVIVLYQKVVGDQGYAWIKRFRLETERCSWSRLPSRGRMLAE